MMPLIILREAVGCYLVLTLTATGLAKAKSWRTASLGITRERVIPRRLALPVALTLCAAEVGLALLVAGQKFEEAAGISAAALFLAFAVYKAAVVIKTGKDSCSCTGTSTMFKATRPSIVASFVSSVIQGAGGLLWAFGPPPDPRSGLVLLTSIAALHNPGCSRGLKPPVSSSDLAM